jgi:hypothetical protein
MILLSSVSASISPVLDGSAGVVRLITRHQAPEQFCGNLKGLRTGASGQYGIFSQCQQLTDEEEGAEFGYINNFFSLLLYCIYIYIYIYDVYNFLIKLMIGIFI